MIWALAARFWREGLILAAAATAVSLWVARDRALEARGVALERARIADSTIAAVTPALARVEAKVVRDTVRIRTTIARLDTLRDTVLRHLTDTVLVERFVREADTVAATCTELGRDCAAFRLLANTKIAALEQKLAVQPITIARSCTPSNVLWGIAGVGAGYFTARLSR